MGCCLMRQVSWALSHGRCLIPRSPPCAAFLPRIDDADHPLGAGMDVYMSDFDCLLVTAPVLVQCFDELELQTQQPSAITPVHADISWRTVSHETCLMGAVSWAPSHETVR